MQALAFHVIHTTTQNNKLLRGLLEEVSRRCRLLEEM